MFDLKELETEVRKFEKSNKWCNATDFVVHLGHLLKNALIEIKRLQEYEAAIKKAHNGYDPAIREATTIKEPESPADAITELIDEAVLVHGIEITNLEYQVELLKNKIKQLPKRNPKDYTLADVGQCSCGQTLAPKDSVCNTCAGHVKRLCREEMIKLRDLIPGPKCNRLFEGELIQDVPVKIGMPLWLIDNFYEGHTIYSVHVISFDDKRSTMEREGVVWRWKHEDSYTSLEAAIFAEELKKCD